VEVCCPGGTAIMPGREEAGNGIEAMTAERETEAKTSEVIFMGDWEGLNLQHFSTTTRTAVFLFRDIPIFQAVTPPDREHPNRSPWGGGRHVGRRQIDKDRYRAQGNPGEHHVGAAATHPHR